jgi:hypothetical protein
MYKKDAVGNSNDIFLDSAFYIAINHPDKSKNRDYAERGIRIYN